ncbi:Peptidyl-tRNA hydrolase [Candidatus Hartigia pinicola]|nr:Peptidyl-tRNA hydrolase [Candidatus Hartigia pinicola]
MSKIKLIVGLANLGVEYDKTRHNAGAWYVTLLTNRYHKKLKKEVKFFGYTSCIHINSNDVHLLIPNTFMNLSGKSILTVANFYHINPHEILIAHDELNFPPGVAKIKLGGSNNGHNGLKDIENKFNNTNFYRLRIGIGHPGDKNKVVDFVLSNPTIFEQKLINQAIDESVRCTDIFLTDSMDKAISRLHSFKVSA